jgi:hypothetical protein
VKLSLVAVSVTEPYTGTDALKTALAGPAPGARSP